MLLTRLFILSLLTLPSVLLSADGESWVSLKVVPQMSITLDNNSFTFPDPTPSHYNQGYIEASAALTGTFSSNDRWQIDIHSEDASLGTLGGRDKPIADLKWKRSDRSNWKNMKTSPKRVMRGRRARNRSLSLDFQILMDWVDDVPGTYEADLVITMGSQA